MKCVIILVDLIHRLRVLNYNVSQVGSTSVFRSDGSTRPILSGHLVVLLPDQDRYCINKFVTEKFDGRGRVKNTTRERELGWIAK